MKRYSKLIFVLLLLTPILVAPVLAELPEKTDGFVCPVLGGKGGQNALAKGKGKFVPIAGGDITVIGPEVHVPIHATNNNGRGRPDGPHMSPGDSDYSPIWATPPIED